jgi:hypothetical protein
MKLSALASLLLAFMTTVAAAWDFGNSWSGTWSGQTFGPYSNTTNLHYLVRGYDVWTDAVDNNGKDVPIGVYLYTTPSPVLGQTVPFRTIVVTKSNPVRYNEPNGIAFANNGSLYFIVAPINAGFIQSNARVFLNLDGQ